MTELEDLITGLVEHEQRLQFHRFDNADAWRLGRLMAEAAIERALPIAIDIRRHGHQLFHVALPGTAPDNDAWIERKIRVVNRFEASSFLVGRRLELKGQTLADSGLDEAAYAAHGGSFPIRIAGVGVVGTVTVSGLPQAEDHRFVVELIGTFLTF